MSRNRLEALHDRVKEMLLDACQGANISVMETSKSWVFLTPVHVYKLKKRIRDELQDLTSLRARHNNALTEIDLNRRLAPQTYLGAVRIFEHIDQEVRLDGPGQTVDWMVQMRRLPTSRMLDQVIRDHDGDPATLSPFVEILARKLVDFYQSCPGSNLTAEELLSIAFDQQSQNRTVLFDPLFGACHARFEAVLSLLNEMFEEVFDLMSERVANGWIRECHGDLRLEHICLTEPPVIFDCLEFNRNLRLLDPFQEVVQLGLEADLLDAPWIKTDLLDALERDLGPRPDTQLLRFYEVMHALLRTRLSLAHLLIAEPRTPQKWLPLGLQYFAIAERLLNVQPA